MSSAEDPRLLALLSRAFHRGPAHSANQDLQRCRQREEGEWLSYELLLPQTEPVRHLVEKVLPKLVYFLDCRGAKLPNAEGVFASIFYGEWLYCVDAGVLIEALSEFSGLSFQQMEERYGADAQPSP